VLFWLWRVAASEAIAAGRLIGTKQFILLHGQIVPGGLTLRVKTADAGFTNTVAKLCQAALA
jgi:hypothetical protein